MSRVNAGVCTPIALQKEVIDISNKISYKAMIGSQKLDTFFKKEQREEEE
jgi:hypothetical protein